LLSDPDTWVFEAEGWTLWDRIAAWASGAGSSVTWPELPEQITIATSTSGSRWVAIADAVGGDWPERARAAAVALVVALREAEGMSEVLCKRFL
jgi:hypothetical protein